MASKSAARKAPTHPPTWEMLKSAILSLKDRQGSSRQSVYKYIQSNYKVTMNEQFKSLMKRTLSKGVKDGKLIMNKGSFKLSAAEKSPPKPKKVVKKPKAAAKKVKKTVKPKKSAGDKPSTKKATKPTKPKSAKRSNKKPKSAVAKKTSVTKKSGVKKSAAK